MFSLGTPTHMHTQQNTVLSVILCMESALRWCIILLIAAIEVPSLSPSPSPSLSLLPSPSPTQEVPGELLLSNYNYGSNGEISIYS